MEKIKYILPVSLLILSTAQAGTFVEDPVKDNLNRFFLLEVKTEKATATELTKSEACKTPNWQVSENGNTKRVVSWIKDNCSEGIVPPNVIYLIQSNKLGK